MKPATYILASRPRGALYVGSTTDLIRRVHEHRSGAVFGFTQKYGIARLVWFEQWELVAEAAHRERRIKRWRRVWKEELIEAENPTWRDLWLDIATP
ncbi:MAG: GIY-YIG nuclease family protein [Rhodospirillaceae bacterium]|jgi:putative endonuclease|nr:GIY-YIG nuclease family protein [Rhodospirillaceae bacterium]